MNALLKHLLWSGRIFKRRKWHRCVWEFVHRRGVTACLQSTILGKLKQGVHCLAAFQILSSPLWVFTNVYSFSPPLCLTSPLIIFLNLPSPIMCPSLVTEGLNCKPRLLTSDKGYGLLINPRYRPETFTSSLTISNWIICNFSDSLTLFKAIHKGGDDLISSFFEPKFSW